MASQDALLPLPHNLRCDRPFLLVRQLTDIPAQTIKNFLGGVVGYGEEDFNDGVAGVL